MIHEDCDGTVEESARKTVLESRGAEVVTKSCSECNYRVNSIEVDNRVTTEEGLHTLMGQLYQSFYDNPRSIGYMVLGSLVDLDELLDDEEISDIAVVDTLAAVVDMAVQDADDREPRTQDEIREAVLG